jgi:ribosomal protein S15P/S13E
MIGARKRHLAYLKNKDEKRYQNLIQRLGLRR